MDASTWDHGNAESLARTEYGRAQGELADHYVDGPIMNISADTTEEDTDFTDATISNKQHSLSDDHLHAHAQRDGVTKFSDVPPVLVDSHPTALNSRLLEGLIDSPYPFSNRQFIPHSESAGNPRPTTTASAEGLHRKRART